MQLELAAMKAKPITLEVRGVLVPSFKNSKVMVFKTKQGTFLPRPLLITKKDYSKRMEEITDSFVSQLRCAFQTEDGKTLTGASLHSSIALSVPDDDCWTRILDVRVKSELCSPGNEGVTITIERL